MHLNFNTNELSYDIYVRNIMLTFFFRISLFFIYLFIFLLYFPNWTESQLYFRASYYQFGVIKYTYTFNFLFFFKFLLIFYILTLIFCNVIFFIFVFTLRVDELFCLIFVHVYACMWNCECCVLSILFTYPSFLYGFFVVF